MRIKRSVVAFFLTISTALGSMTSFSEISKAATDIAVIQTDATDNSASFRWKSEVPVDIYVNSQRIVKNYKKSSYKLKIKGMAPGMRYNVIIVPAGETGGKEYSVRTRPQLIPIGKVTYTVASDVITTNWTPNSLICDGYQVASYSMKGKCLKKAYVTDKQASSTIENVYKNNSFNKVRVRGYIQLEKKKVYGDWSSYRYVAHMKGMKFTPQKKHVIKASWKKVKDASKYKVYIGEKSDGSDKKLVKTVSAKSKPTCTITKYGPLPLEYDKYYYVFIKPYTKVKKKQKSSDISVTSPELICYSWD